MEYTTLISVAELAQQRAADWVVVDCRSGGRGRYLDGHLPSAVYAHLEEDLSGEIVPGKTGRHPLPDPAAMAGRLSAWGIGNQTQVVAYDDRDGALHAARLWWILRWLGHAKVAVLDGGLAAWIAADLPLEQGAVDRAPQQFIPHPRPDLIVDADEVWRVSADPGHKILDARSRERYLGLAEPIDAIAGHVPGALSYPFAANVDESGRFLPREALRERFAPLVRDTSPEQVISYCGSGVTAAHNILALEHAGIADTRLYVGSWSDWITDPERPIERGESSAANH